MGDIGGYFDARINSPHNKTSDESSFMVKARTYNQYIPENLYMIVGDPSLELQAQVINQISGQTLPVESWKNVHNWLTDLIDECTNKLGRDSTTVFVDCNPSFSAYTELSILSVNALIIPCSSNGSSARAIDNIGSLLYGVATGKDYGAANFSARARFFSMDLPKIHSVVLSRSTQYNKKASKAFGAMFDAIRERAEKLAKAAPMYFGTDGPLFSDIPDSHSVAIVCSHLGKPLYQLKPGKYEVYDTEPQVNDEPFDRYKTAMKAFISSLSI